MGSRWNFLIVFIAVCFIVSIVEAKANPKEPKEPSSKSPAGGKATETTKSTKQPTEPPQKATEEEHKKEDAEKAKESEKEAKEEGKETKTDLKTKEGEAKAHEKGKEEEKENEKNLKTEEEKALEKDKEAGKEPSLKGTEEEKETQEKAKKDEKGTEEVQPHLKEKEPSSKSPAGGKATETTKSTKQPTKPPKQATEEEHKKEDVEKAKEPEKEAKEEGKETKPDLKTKEGEAKAHEKGKEEEKENEKNLKTEEEKALEKDKEAGKEPSLKGTEEEKQTQVKAMKDEKGTEEVQPHLKEKEAEKDPHLKDQEEEMKPHLIDKEERPNLKTEGEENLPHKENKDEEKEPDLKGKEGEDPHLKGTETGKTDLDKPNKSSTKYPEEKLQTPSPDDIKQNTKKTHEKEDASEGQSIGTTPHPKTTMSKGSNSRTTTVSPAKTTKVGKPVTEEKKLTSAKEGHTTTVLPTQKGKEKGKTTSSLGTTSVTPKIEENGKTKMTTPLPSSQPTTLHKDVKKFNTPGPTSVSSDGGKGDSSTKIPGKKQDEDKFSNTTPQQRIYTTISPLNVGSTRLTTTSSLDTQKKGSSHKKPTTPSLTTVSQKENQGSTIATPTRPTTQAPTTHGLNPNEDKTIRTSKMVTTTPATITAAPRGNERKETTETPSGGTTTIRTHIPPHPTRPSLNADGYELLDLSPHSFGGPPQLLNSHNNSTMIMVAPPLPRAINITGWQFYAESMRPFYAGVFTPVKMNHEDKIFSVAFKKANYIVPKEKDKEQEVRIESMIDIIQADKGDFIGVYYEQATSDLPEGFTGTVPVERPYGVKSPGHATEWHLGYFLILRTPDQPYFPGQVVTGTNLFKRALALSAISEPDIRMHSLTNMYHIFKGMQDRIDIGYMKVNYNRIMGGICEDKSRIGSVAMAYGNIACQRAKDNDPDYFLLYYDVIDGSRLDPPAPKPVFSNPICKPTADEMFAGGCVNTGNQCTVQKTPILVCARRSQLREILASMTTSLSTTEVEPPKDGTTGQQPPPRPSSPPPRTTTRRPPTTTTRPPTTTTRPTKTTTRPTKTTTRPKKTTTRPTKTTPSTTRKTTTSPKPPKTTTTPRPKSTKAPKSTSATKSTVTSPSPITKATKKPTTKEKGEKEELKPTEKTKTEPKEKPENEEKSTKEPNKQTETNKPDHEEKSPKEPNDKTKTEKETENTDKTAKERDGKTEGETGKEKEKTVKETTPKKVEEPKVKLDEDPLEEAKTRPSANEKPSKKSKKA